jgi:hypothetical protein
LLGNPKKWAVFHHISQSTWIFLLVSGMKFVSHWISMKHFSLTSPEVESEIFIIPSWGAGPPARGCHHHQPTIPWSL